MSEERAEELFRQALEPGAECPGEERLAAWVEGALAADAMAETKAHLEACPRCEARAKLYAAFIGAEAGPGEAQNVEAVEEKMRPKSASRPDVPPFVMKWLALPGVPKWALAAAVVLGITAGTMHLRSVWRPMIHPGEARVLRASAVRALSPSGELAQAPKEMRWEAVEGAARYEVVVSEVDGTEVARIQAEGSTVAAPAAAAEVPPRKTLMWKVAALGADGKTMGESQWVRFRVVPEE